MALIVALIIGYVLASLNSAILLCKTLRLPDPRKAGSGNPGATNVLRIAGRNTAAVVLILDALKGLIPVMIATSVFGLQGAPLALVVLAACLGHAFPVFFQFDGGKGIATLFGGLIGLNLVLTLLLGLIWVGTALLSRYSSLASLTVIVLTPFIMLIDHVNFFVPLLLTTLLLVWNHRGNIQRLRQGKEPQIGE